MKLPLVEKLAGHLRHEAAFRRHFHDPQVVEVIEARLDADPPFLVMPFVEGRNLAFPDAAPAALPIGERILRALETFHDLASTVARLHEAGIVHGDLKPGNVLVDGAGRCRLLDLGLARVELRLKRDRPLAQSLVSVDGRSIAGSLEYMAPEVQAGAEPGAAADVYALGVILHGLLTGRPPAFGVSPASLSPYLPPGTEALLRRMLHYDPARRAARAGELAPEIERLLRIERRCAARRNGHERRRVFRSRMQTLRRGLRALLLLAAAPAALVCAVLVADGASSGAWVLRGSAMTVGILIGSAIFFLCAIAILLGITTINAWILGIPERSYKERKGHPLWSFMMQ